MYKKVFIPVVICILAATHGYSQRELKTLPSNINRPSINLYFPFISGDGQTLLYLSDYTDDGYWGMRWATKKTVSTWNDGQIVNKLINRPTLNFTGGYSLSFDGDMMYFTSLKSGLGGFDIWSSRRRGNDWEAPKNLGLPVNSRENEGSPMLSPDGEYLYFMRCEKMKPYGGASGCKIYYSKMRLNRWSEPVELPANINTGNSQTPRLLADGETLIFSSDQMGGQGGLDLFMSKKVGENEWSDPVPMDFANTPDNDSFVSIPAKGRYMYKSIKGDRDYELVEVLIPEEFQPKDVMRVTGLITDENGEPLDAELTIFDIDNRDRLWNENVGNKGEFAIVLKEGSSYDLSVNNGDPNYMYYSKVYDLEKIGRRDKETLNIKIKPLKVQETYPLDILFETHGKKVRDISIYELRRLGDYIRKNEALKVAIEVHQTQYKEDSVQSDPDLTEMRIDTTFFEKPHVDPRSIAQKHDSIFNLLAKDWPTDYEATIDSINYVVRLSEDSVIINEVVAIETDSMVNDTTALTTPPPQPDTVKTSYPLLKYKTQIKYHNDRTEAQAEAIYSFLIDRGVQPRQVEVIGIKDEESADDEDKPAIQVFMKVLAF